MFLVCCVGLQKIDQWALASILWEVLALLLLQAVQRMAFFSDETLVSYAILWRAALIAIGAVALAGWYVGAAFIRNKQVAWWIKKFAIVQFSVFTLIILFYSQQFLLAAVNYLPAAFFLLFVFIRSYFKTNERAPLYGAIGIILTFIGSFIQIAKISLHPQYFNYNALYHASRSAYYSSPHGGTS